MNMFENKCALTGAAIAQWTERPPSKRNVRGSSPASDNVFGIMSETHAFHQIQNGLKNTYRNLNETLTVLRYCT